MVLVGLLNCKCDLSEFFTIGKMIEIIKDSSKEELMLLINNDECSATLLCCGGGISLGNDYKELCDVLWSAVKKLIES